MDKKTAFMREDADDSPGFLLYRLTLLWQEKLGEIFEKLGLNQTRYAILATLKYFEERGMTSSQNQIVQQTKIDKMTLSKSVRVLERDQLVIRSPSLSDSRSMVVSLTSGGRKLVSKAIHEVETADEEFFSCMSEEQMDQFKEISLLLIEAGARNNLDQ